MTINTLPDDEFCPNLVGALQPAAPGSQRYSCVFCHGDAWLARSGQARVRRFPETKVICFNCLVVRANLETAEVYAPTPETILRDLQENE